MLITAGDLSNVRVRHSNQKIVLTSGTFDLLHTGHLNYLEQVRKHGDVVIVLLSGDDRVKARKGQNRPIISESDRAKLLDSLKAVDYVIIDPGEQPPNQTDPVHAEIIQNLLPDYYVTDGPDPRFVNIIDKPKFIILDRLNPEPSTTSIINRIRSLPG